MRGIMTRIVFQNVSCKPKKATASQMAKYSTSDGYCMVGNKYALRNGAILCQNCRICGQRADNPDITILQHFLRSTRWLTVPVVILHHDGYSSGTSTIFTAFLPFLSRYSNKNHVALKQEKNYVTILITPQTSTILIFRCIPLHPKH